MPGGKIIAKHIVVLITNNFSREGSGALRSLGKSNSRRPKALETNIMMNAGVCPPLKVKKALKDNPAQAAPVHGSWFLRLAWTFSEKKDAHGQGTAFRVNITTQAKVRKMKSPNYLPDDEFQQEYRLK